MRGWVWKPYSFIIFIRIPALSSLDLSNDDISDDAACAKIIEQREGFKYWKGWSRYCRNTQNLPNLAVSCNLPAIGS